MQKRMSAVLIVVCLLSSSVFGLAPMGPSRAELSQGQLSAGVEYSYTLMDVELTHGLSPGGVTNFTMNGFKMNYVGAKIGHGCTDNIEGFIRLGGANARGDDTESGTAINFGGDNGFALGLGVKATLVEEVDIQWGCQFQILWANGNGKATLGGRNWDINIDVTEIQIAAGPSYKLRENVLLYGGPFFHYFDGHLKGDPRSGAAGTVKYDIDESANFGGYIGSQIDVAANTTLNIEYQHTSNADALGLNMTWKF